jgi:hypothetical protein
MTVKDAVKAAEGASEFADYFRIRVIHSNGTHDDYKYAKILKGEIEDPVLLPADRVYVTTPYF